MNKITEKTGISTTLQVVIVVLGAVFSVGMVWSTIWHLPDRVNALEEDQYMLKENDIMIDGKLDVIANDQAWIRRAIESWTPVDTCANIR